MLLSRFCLQVKRHAYCTNVKSPILYIFPVTLILSQLKPDLYRILSYTIAPSLLLGRVLVWGTKDTYSVSSTRCWLFLLFSFDSFCTQRYGSLMQLRHLDRRRSSFKCTLPPWLLFCDYINSFWKENEASCCINA